MIPEDIVFVVIPDNPVADKFPKLNIPFGSLSWTCNVFRQVVPLPVNEGDTNAAAGTVNVGACSSGWLAVIVIWYCWAAVPLLPPLLNLVAGHVTEILGAAFTILLNRIQL